MIGGGRLNLVPMAGPGRLPRGPGQPVERPHVLVAGRFAKRDGELVGVDVHRAVQLAREASERVLGTVAAGGELLPPAPEASPTC